MCTLHVLVFIIFNLHVRDLPSFLTQKQIMYIGVKVLVTYDVAYTFESKESEDIFLMLF